MDPVAGPLAPLRVLDLADYRAAFCGRLLAELGASVVKVEPPGGDPSRHLPPFTPAAGPRRTSLFFVHANAGKDSVVLDGTVQEDRLLALAAAADVLIVSATPAALRGTALDYARLSPERPELVYVSITPYGVSGPWGDRAASDLTIQAAGGMVWLNGDPGEPPLQGVGLPAYHLASLAAAVGTLLAVLARQRTGRGQLVDVSMHAAAAAGVTHATALYRETGRVLARRGPRHWSDDFHVGPTADGDLLHAVLGDWGTLREWVNDGQPGPLDDPALETVEGRRTRADRVFAILDAWAATGTAETLASEAQLRRLAYAAVRAPRRLRDDAQLRARQFFVAVRPGDGGPPVHQARAPYRFSATACHPPAPPPVLPAPSRWPSAAGWARVERAAGPPNTATGLPTASSHPGLSVAVAPLSGIRVLDLSWLVAGPVATRVLADHGADVIRLERPPGAIAPGARGGLAGCLNRGKRSIGIDLGHAAGRALAERLLTVCDVLVENFSPRVLGNWGWDDARLQELNPRLVTLHLSAFGRSGPDRDAVAFGPTLHARAGHTWLMRHASGRRAGWGFSFSDIAAGWRGALAVGAALWHRTVSGNGQAIDLSQYENLVDLLGAAGLGAVNASPIPRPIDNRSQEMPSAPHGVFLCADEVRDGQRGERWCAIAVLQDAHWHALRTAIGDPPWARARRLQTAPGRRASAAALHRHVAAWTRPRSAATVVATLADAGVPAALVADPADVCQDPQLAFRGFWTRVATPDGGSVVVDGLPFRLAATPGAVRGPAPRPGEDTDAVLRSLAGATDCELARLRASRTIT